VVSAIGALKSDRLWQLVAAALVVGAITSLAVGGPPALIVFVIGIAVVAVAGRLAEGRTDARLLTQVMLLALGARSVLAAAIHLVLLTRNTRGNMFSDDAGYAIAANALAQAWRGTPLSDADYAVVSDPSIVSVYTTMLAAVIWAFGHSWLGIKLVNTVLGVVQAALVYRTMRNLGMPGARLAAAIVLVFPSLVLWGALALKDTAALTALLVVTWSVSEFQRSGRLWWWILTILAFFWIRDVRLYVFLIVAFAWPLTLLILRQRRRWVLGGAAALISAGMILTSPGTSYFDPRILSSIAYTRSVMAQNARSAYVEPLTVLSCAPGDTFAIEVLGRTRDPAIPARRLEVRPGTQLVPEGAAPPSAAPGSTPRPVTIVRPDDVVVCLDVETVAAGATPTPNGGGDGSPEPEPSPPASVEPEPTPTSEPVAAQPPQPRVLRVQVDRANVVATPRPPSALPGPDALTFVSGLEANVRHFPIGVLFLIAAPFPLTASTVTEVALIPEMLLWYALVALALVGLVALLRRRDLRFLFGLLVLGAIGLVLSLAEGNVGTLVRHRGMLVPLVIMLAAVGWTIARPLIGRFVAQRSGPSRPL
jgi:hypothetical protein